MLTDNEIKKALECCTRSGCSDNETADCPLKHFEDCSTRLAVNALDLINRLQAENERLQEKLQNLCTAVAIGNKKKFAKELKKFKTEAIKEFAERLKELIPHFSDGYTTMECVEGAVKYLVKEIENERDE